MLLAGIVIGHTSQLPVYWRDAVIHLAAVHETKVDKHYMP